MFGELMPGIVVGATVTVTCPNGQLIVITCTDDATWVRPTCPKTCPGDYTDTVGLLLIILNVVRELKLSLDHSCHSLFCAQNVNEQVGLSIIHQKQINDQDSPYFDIASKDGFSLFQVGVGAFIRG